MRRTVFVIVFAVGIEVAAAQPVQVARQFALEGDLAHADNLSGAAFWGNLLIACPDEGAEINVLNAADGKLSAKFSLLSDSDDEIDIEAAASDSRHVYVVGSHSMRRKQVDSQSSRKKNRKRLAQVRPHSESYSLFRLTLDAQGELKAKERISLQDVLESDPIMSPYTTIPGKENGIDVEGIAVKDGRLYVGFRGPVLRGNFVPVLSFEFERLRDYELKFVQLDGRGIRDMTAVDGGFLILAGPVGDGDANYKLYLWNGEDCVSGGNAFPGCVVFLGEAPEVDGAKPEGIAPISEDLRQWRILLLCDGDAVGREVIVAKP